MDPTHLMTIPCTIHHVTQDGPADEYGNPTEQVTDTDSVCWMHQKARDDTAGTQNAADRDALQSTQIEQWEAYFPPADTLTGNDRVTIPSFDEDNPFQVVGPPWRAHNPRLGRVVFIEATLERTT